MYRDETGREFFNSGEPVPEESAETRRRRERQELRDRQAADALKKPRGRRCQICHHPERARIEALHVAGVGIDRLAAKFGVHRDAIWRHCQRHMTDEQKASYLAGPAKIAQLAEVAAEESESVLDYYSILRSALFNLIDQRAGEGDHTAVALLSARAVEVLKQIGKVTGQVSELASSTIINVQNNSVILNSAPFADLQTGLLSVCAEHPEARPAIVALLNRLDAKYSAAAPAKTINAIPVMEAAQ